MTRNIYDDPAFFAAYGRLPRSVEGLAGAAEWPALRALLPPLAGLRVVDLGCGYGWFCRHAREQGAASVLGIDGSAAMLAKAAAMTNDATIAYRLGDLEHPDLPAGAFDLAFSSLVLHYIADLAGLLRAVHAALVPGGRLVVSLEHPVFMAPRRPDWQAAPDGAPFWPLDGYGDEGPRVTDWLAPGVVKQHRMMGTTLNALIAAGFRLDHVEEWRPSDADLAAHPDWATERDRPMFLLLAATREAA